MCVGVRIATFDYLRTPNDLDLHRWVKRNVNAGNISHRGPHYRCKMLGRYFRTVDGPTMWHCMARQQLLTPATR